MVDTPGLSTPVCAIGPSSMMRLTSMCPAAFFMVQPMPLSWSFTSVTRFRPVCVCVYIFEYAICIRGGRCGGRRGGDGGRRGDKKLTVVSHDLLYIL